MSELRESDIFKDVQKTLQPSFSVELPRQRFSYYADLLSHTQTDIESLRRVGRSQEADALENSRRNTLAKRFGEIDQNINAENISNSVTVPLSKTDLDILIELAEQKSFGLDKKGTAMANRIVLEDAYEKASRASGINKPGLVNRFLNKFKPKSGS